MHLLRPVARCITLGFAAIALSASLALAGHVAPVLPLTSGGNHSHQKFTNTLFPAANLSNINLRFADLSNCTFAPGTDLSNADFSGAKLFNSVFSGCDLTGARFRGADLSGSVFGCIESGEFRGAILTGATFSCSACTQFSNIKDDCTAGNPVELCLFATPFRANIAGVVFDDANMNGVLDHGEPGVPGVTVIVETTVGTEWLVTDSRGAYLTSFFHPSPGSARLDIASLPAGTTTSGPTSHGFDLSICRSAQSLNFAVLSPATSIQSSSFGRLKLNYR